MANPGPQNHPVRKAAVNNRMGVFALTCVTTALFLTLRNMPAMAQTGMEMVFFNIVAVFAFLIPTALVAAELATGWPANGVFGWVQAAFGERAGLLASWLQWGQSLFGLTSILAYAGGTFAYVLAPDLGMNRWFIVGSILVVYWGGTFLNFAGTRRSGQISTVCLLAGVLTPSVILVGAGVWWIASGHGSHLELSFTPHSLLPSAGSTEVLVLFLSFVFGFVGIEVSASHASEIDNARRSYPIALFTAALLGFAVTLAGALAIAVVLPGSSIDTINGAIQALSTVFTAGGLGWLVPVLAFLIAFGAAGQVATWIVGPVKGLAAAGELGYLPPAVLRTNAHDVPTRLLILQATCVSLVGLVFLVVPSVNTGFLILTSIAVVLYCITYVLMFTGAIRLRITHPEVERAYKVPGGIFGMGLVAGLGLATVMACFVIGFIPPSPNPLSSFWAYGAVLGIVLVLMSVVPLLACKRWAPS